MRPARSTQRALACLLALLGLPLASAPIFAAEEPVVAESTDMTPAVAAGLNDVIDKMNAGQLDDALASMHALRTSLEEGMSPYERFVTLQTSANLNTLLFKYPEALADYEALLQSNVLTASDRLATANLTGQLYLQVQDWKKGIEHLLDVNEMQGGADKETLFRIAFAYSQDGDPRGAVPYMEQAVAAAGSPVPEDYLRNMAVLYMQTQSPREAIAIYEDLLAAYPDVADRERVLANMAALHIDAGNNARATSLLRQLLREYPNSGQRPTYQQSLDALTAG